MPMILDCQENQSVRRDRWFRVRNVNGAAGLATAHPPYSSRARGVALNGSRRSSCDWLVSALIPDLWVPAICREVRGAKIRMLPCQEFRTYAARRHCGR